MTTATSTVPRFRALYDEEIAPKLREEFGYDNVMRTPRIERIVLNIGMGEALSDANSLERASQDLAAITGQRPVVTRAKKSIANFRLREGNPIGVTVSLRGARMYEFLDRLISAALPSIRDFQGLSRDAFDGRGNYSLGLREQLIFPELEFDNIDKVRGLQVTIVTSATNDEEGRRMLELFGMPFTRN